MNNYIKKNIVLEGSYIPIINYIIERRGLNSFDEFCILAINEFINSNKHLLPQDLQNIPQILSRGYIRDLINKEINDLKDEINFIKETKNFLKQMSENNASIEYYSLYFLSCKKKLMTFKNKNELYIQLKKIFKEHLMSMAKMNNNLPDNKNNLKNIKIISFMKKNKLIDDIELVNFIEKNKYIIFDKNGNI